MDSTNVTSFAALNSGTTPNAVLGMLDFNLPTAGVLSWTIQVQSLSSTSATLRHMVPANTTINTIAVWLGLIDTAWSSLICTQ